jgi:hypothetical protein
MLLGNCTVGRSFYLSMTEQSTEGNGRIQRQKFVALRVLISVIQTAVTVNVIKKVCTSIEL